MVGKIVKRAANLYLRPARIPLNSEKSKVNSF